MVKVGQVSLYIHTPDSMKVDNAEWEKTGLKWMKISGGNGLTTSSLSEVEDKDVSATDNKDLCDELTVSSEKELRSKLKGMTMSSADRKKVEKIIDEKSKNEKRAGSVR